MAAPRKNITPSDRIEGWRKLWATPKLLSPAQTDAAFEEFQEAFVRPHMRKIFLKGFGHPKATFGSRFFLDDVFRHNWKTRLAQLLGEVGGNIEAIVIYATPDALEAHLLRGERRRSLRDVIVDDWHAACAIIRASDRVVYLFIEPKMGGCLTRTVLLDSEEPEAHFIEHDDDRF